MLELWKRTGWNQQQVNVGGTLKTLRQVWLPDDLHPHSDSTGEATDYLAKIIAGWMVGQR